MSRLRLFLAPFLLCLQLMLAAGGPVLAQYCCGQRVELQADCGSEACCPPVDECCEEEPADDDACCGDDIDLTLEFTQVGAVDEAVAVSVSQRLDPPVVLCESDVPQQAAYELSASACDVREDARRSIPPKQKSLGVWRL